MKLRNKKTGEIVETDYKFGVNVPTNDTFGYKSYDEISSYNSLAELNENWEDYKQAEPLIKDEKIRKAVRAWAILNRIDEVNYCLNDEDGSSLIYTTEASSLVLDFCFEIEELEVGKTYTIAELCGEEEEC